MIKNKSHACHTGLKCMHLLNWANIKNLRLVLVKNMCKNPPKNSKFCKNRAFLDNFERKYGFKCNYAMKHVKYTFISMFTQNSAHRKCVLGA